MAIQTYIAAPPSSGGGGALTLATVTVNTDVATKQELVAAVAAGFQRVVTQVIIRNASADLTAMADNAVLSFGARMWNGFSAGAQLSLLTTSDVAAALCFDFASSVLVVGIEGEAFGITFNDASITATVDVDIIYYDVSI